MELAGHNNIEKYAKDYSARVKAFIEHVDKCNEHRTAADDSSDEEIWN